MKATNAEVRQRVEEVLRIRLDGAQLHDVVQYASEKGWNVGERQLFNYVRRADRLLAERLDRKRGRVVALHLARREALYARAVNAADYRTALAVLSDEAKLRGLYPAPKPADPPAPPVRAAVELPPKDPVDHGHDAHLGGTGI